MAGRNFDVACPMTNWLADGNEAVDKENEKEQKNGANDEKGNEKKYKQQEKKE